MTINADDILAVTRKVTALWTKQRKAEDRSNRSKASREYMCSSRVDFTSVAGDILHKGYAHASGGGQYTVDKRQFYYACRDEFYERTDRHISADYFSQKLIVQYMNKHPRETAGWKLTASPRGSLIIPNSIDDNPIPCGTVAIERHLNEAGCYFDPLDMDYMRLNIEWPSLAEGQRYQGVLYIEKEGFEPQLREAGIAERFDVAIISCKGQSVVAARRFVDHVCRVDGGVPLFTMHDFDPSGFSIAERLTSVSDYARENDLVKYEIENTINVVDLGLRLQDVEKYNLKSERFKFRGLPSDTTATAEEQEFFRSGRHVELNAFTAPQFIEWTVTGLSKYLKKFVPRDEILQDAYRRALAVARVNAAIGKAMKDAIENAKLATVPKTLRKLLANSKQPWDRAIYGLAESKFLRISTIDDFYFFEVTSRRRWLSVQQVDWSALSKPTATGRTPRG